MEEETHVDSTSSGDQADICQTLFDIVKDHSDIHRRAVKETAISGHPQSDQLRSGKPDGEPGTHITTNISDMQSQMVEGNLSLNAPNIFAGNPLHDVYCSSKCKPMDESIFMFKLVFKEYLTPNVMQITLINQVPYMETCS